ncbi:Uncharacterized protein TCM_045192 [Theobroma cacao]|uniref:Uncharacterized protein n=1 Tax=Theobroma cacao TaxID=3641 RepID=A0A061FRX6_THECC|nr:Uncharacterized protein TCM_045192 [Theobroma cacao]
MKKERREVRLAGCGRTLPGTSLTCQTRKIRVWQGSGNCPLMPRDKAMESAPSRAQKSVAIPGRYSLGSESESRPHQYDGRASILRFRNS